MTNIINMVTQAQKIAEVISSYQKLQFKYINDKHSRKIAMQNIKSVVEKYLKEFPSQPLQFVLPGFPFKFPIRTIFGYKMKQNTIIDASDYFAILQLEKFIKDLNSVYEPGITIDILMDSEGFMDLENISQEIITQYKSELYSMIKKLQLDKNIRFISYTDLKPKENFHFYQRRTVSTLETYIEKKKLKDDFLKRYIGLSEYQRKQLHQLLTIKDEDLSDNLLQRKRNLENRFKRTVKEVAYQHLWHQDTWRHIVSEYFPKHLRLTIHPQSPDSEKIGFYLSNKSNIFAPVPWQGVPLRIITSKKTTIDMIIDYEEILHLETVTPLENLYFKRINCGLPCFVIDSKTYKKMMENLYLKRTKRITRFQVR